MDTPNIQNNRGKNIGRSILAGVGYGMGGLLLGTIIPAAAVYLFFEVGTGMCFETCFFGIYFLSPLLGLCIAFVVGIISGWRTHKRLSEKK